MNEEKLAVIWQKDRFIQAYHFLLKQGLTKEELCKDLQIGHSSLHHWMHYGKPIFQPSMWRKLSPFLEKHGINPEFIRGNSKIMLLNDADVSQDEKWQDEMLSLARQQLEQMTKTTEAMEALVEILATGRR